MEKQTNDKVSEQKALQVKIQAQVQSLSDEEKMLFKIYASENQNARMGIPEIRVNYDEENGVEGGFIVIDYEDQDEAGNSKKRITFLDKEIEVTIMRTRFKFGYFDQDKGKNGMELYGTPELDDYSGIVNLWDNEQKKIIYTGKYKDFKKFITETYPDARLEAKGFSGSIIKHTEILYVELEDKIHRMYLSKTARDNYWKYKEEIKGVPTFAYKTRLTTSKEKSGRVTYYPIHFEKTSENQIKPYILMRKQLDEDLKIFDEVRESLKGVIDEKTIQGKDPEVLIKEKYKLDFPENFKLPDCPECGKPMVLRDSFKGPFFGCSNFPECKGIKKINEVLEKDALPVINLEDDATSKTTPEPITEPTPEPDEEKGIDPKKIPF